jgi:hypothetical protein
MVFPHRRASLRLLYGAVASLRFEPQESAMSARMEKVGAATAARPDFKPEEKRVIFASSLGTVFEWYDFYLYATLAPFFAALFFPKGNDTAALLSALSGPPMAQ